HSRGLRTNPAFGETTLDDGLLDLLDGHRRLINAEHARGFARRRTDAPGELRKIIRRVQHADSFSPPAPVHQIVPVRNDVVHRAAGMAEGYAAIHAARALGADFVLGEIEIDLKPV